MSRIDYIGRCMKVQDSVPSAAGTLDKELQRNGCALPASVNKKDQSWLHTSVLLWPRSQLPPGPFRKEDLTA